ncbi:MAG TPA: ribosome biogenesis GTPase Der [Caulobacteraceae bacterium]|nr:ribosome biogenesis GTPase Der [Caulobacteraceae bacterium]
MAPRALKLAIVGRPNVGKSTLFNRLAGKKLAIVDDRPGVTRDRRFASGRIGDLDLELIDTAGFEDVADESLEARMRGQTEKAIAEAEVALFLIDAREGLTPVDRTFADLLRRSGKPVVLAANKAEGKQGDHGVLEAYDLGLGEAIALSAEHGEGISDLYYALLAAQPDADDRDVDDEADKPVRIAIVGRPNAGKSTLVNRLVGEDRLLTGPEAGITRDAIPVDWDWEGQKIRLVDTAGLRRKARIHEKLEELSTHDSIRAITFAEIVVLMMDATHPFEVQDLRIADLVEREGRGLVFVLAKWDLITDPQARLKAFIEEADKALPQLRGTPVVALSAETGRGLERLMPTVVKVHKDWSTKVKTRDLNDWLHMAVQRHPPPAVNGKRIKPKYMAQTKARPPTFVLFATRAEQLPEQYRRYMINSIRESFDLPGVPIRLTVKSGANPFAAEEGARPWLADQGRGGPTISARKTNTTAKPRWMKAAKAAVAAATGAPKKSPDAKASPAVKAGAPAKSKASPAVKARAPAKSKTPARGGAKSPGAGFRSRPAKPGPRKGGKPPPRAR